MIQRAHKTKLLPKAKQAIMLQWIVDACLCFWNWSIERCKKAHMNKEKTPTAYGLRSEWKNNKPQWFIDRGIASVCIYSVFFHVYAAYLRFFDRLSKLPPGFRKKGSVRSFTVAGDKTKVVGNKIRIPGIGYIKMAEPLRFEKAKLNSCTVSIEPDGWYVSIQCEISDDIPTPPESVVGVDVGIKCWAIASDETKLELPKRLKHLRRILAKKQRLLSRKQKGSHNYLKAINKIARIHQTIRRISQDAIHKFTTTLAKNHSVIVVEDLNVRGMQESRNRGIRRGINYSEMSAIIDLLEYKAKRLVKVPRFYPSSKACSNCGNVKEDLTLSDRTYVCEACGFTLDRDLNASLNIRKKGLEIIAEGHSESLNDREVERHGDR